MGSAETSRQSPMAPAEIAGRFHSSLAAGHAATNQGSNNGKLVCFIPVSTPAASRDSQNSPLLPDARDR